MEKDSIHTDAPLLQAEHISKSFHGVPALRNGKLTVRAGTVHALCGGNGAGKSTFLNIVMGLLRRDAGSIKLKGVEVDFHSAADALQHGVAIITQELSPVLEMTVAENLFLGREPRRAGVFVDYRKMEQMADDLLKKLKFDVKVNAKMADLSLAKIQLVEIAKALSYDSDIVIMDEPTSAIGEHETHILFDAIKRIKAQGSSIIYVSHRLTEIFEIADDYTVFRDGECVESGQIKDIDRPHLVKAILGHEISRNEASKNEVYGETLLAVKNLTQIGSFENISLKLAKGEIVGIYGLLGSGRTEFLECVYGLQLPTSGVVEFGGRLLQKGNPRESIKRGISLVTEDRKHTGLILGASIKNNISLSTLKSISSFGVVNMPKEGELVRKLSEKLMVKAASLNLAVENLSGGNQQKVVFARCLSSNPKLLICDEPTRGIDEGAKQEIYSLMRDFAKKGGAVLIVSSEAPEILEVCNRIMIFKNGRDNGVIQSLDATQQKMLDMAA